MGNFILHLSPTEAEVLKKNLQPMLEKVCNVPIHVTNFVVGEESMTIARMGESPYGQEIARLTSDNCVTFFDLSTLAVDWISEQLGRPDESLVW
jgi:hypothetical protein